MSERRGVTPRLQEHDFGETPPLEEVNAYAHKDNRGSTHEFACGCKIVFRGIRMQRRFCWAHGTTSPGGNDR